MRPIAAAALLLALVLPAAAQTAPPADDSADWAQTAEGVRLLSGSGSIARIGESTTAFLSPRVGRFVADGLALSAGLNLGYSRTMLATDGEFRSTQLGIGPAVTYYLSPATGDAARPFVEADLQLTATRFDSDLRDALGEGDEWDTSVGGGLAAGVELPLARNVAVRGQAFYRTPDLSFDTDQAFYGLSVGFSTFLY